MPRWRRSDAVKDEKFLLHLLQLFVKMAFFQGSPADVPADRSALTFAVALMVVVNTAVTYTWYGLATGLFVVLLEVVLNGGFLFGCLALRQRKSRFEQSLAAVCGMSAVMAFVAWPWALAVSGNPEDLPAWVLWGQLVLMMWSLLIWSRVLRLACDFNRVTSAALAVSFFFFTAMVMASVLNIFKI